MSGVTTDRILERLPAELGAINALGLLPLPFSIAIYIAFSIDLSLSEWSAFGAVLVAVTGAGWLLSAGMIRRGNAAIVQHLQARAERGADEAMALDAGVAYQASLTLPQRAQRSILIVSFLPVLVAPPALWLLGYEGWLAGSRVVSLLVAALGSSLITSTLAFYRARQSLTFLCSGLARGVGDPEARAQFGNRPSLYRRTQFAVAIPASVILLLAVQVVYQDVRRRAEDEALSWAARAVQAVAEGDLALSVEERVRQQLPPRRFWPVPLSVFEIRAGRVADAFPEPLSKSFLVALDRALGRAEHAGRIAPPAANEVGAYHRSEDGSMLVARVARVDLEDRYAAMNWSIALLVLVLSSVPLLVGRFVARDLASGIDSLRLMLDRMASGDLRPGEGFESDDELGALSRSLEMMGNSLRETVCRMASTAEHIDGVSAGIAAMATEVAGTSADQLQKIQHVDRLMDEINERVAGASQSAAAVTGTIDESSQSVLELGAAGDELNETASLLTSKVDAVSDSLEQMMCSVKRVGATTDRLAEASEETSSSMEEMASAMRGVDTSAETTANLSRDVVDKAELGQAKVVQTIAGMEAIREATDVAESVIRGLGARTSEIGGILDVIDDVADETNLLALNAAIIAAQAGEQGRAFSVVADEIKELADRVLVSTKEIGGLIRAVQGESENAIGAIEAGSKSVMSGVDLSAEAGKTLEEITEASRESGTRIAEIVNSVREQTKAASHVVGLMERVRESADEIGAAGAEQDRGNEVVHRSTSTMREVAQQVRRTTEDQACGIGRIREHVDGVRSAVEGITGVLSAQSGSCREASQHLERASADACSNEEAAQRMREAVQQLVGEAVSLREDVERFRVR